MSNPTNTKSLKILLWNANGLKQNEPELFDLLIDKKIDIALISETHYTTKIKNFFPGFNVYRTDHPDGTAHAGSAIIISSQIKHNLLPSLQLPTIQATNISVTLYLTYSLQYLQFIALLGQQFLPSKPSFFYDLSATRLLLEGTSTPNTPTGALELKTPKDSCSST